MVEARSRGAFACGALLCLLVAGSAFGDTPHTKAPVITSRGDYSIQVYAPATDRRFPLLLLMSGEGGWRNFDQRLAGYFQEQGFWVGGIDCLKYFWKAQDDRKALAADMRAYAKALALAAGRAEDAPLVLAGFSFGADLAPWIAGGDGWGSRIAGLIMLGPDDVGSLQFRVLEVFGFEEHEHIFQVSEALASARGIPLLFIHGGADVHSSAPHLADAAPPPKKILTVPDSDHHFNGHEDDLQKVLAQGVEWLLQTGKRSREIPRETP